MTAPRNNSRACWPLIILWLISTVQYAYRYILQVNDPRSSHIYEATPSYLSALKYEILFLFAAYALLRFWRNSTAIDIRYRSLCYLSGGIVLALSFGLILRVFINPGVWDETTLCALQFVPWIGSALLVPLVVAPHHSARRTLVVFERLMFWVNFPFWIITVVLGFAGVRYPNLSYPGLLRFGGIMDDPNGYACLVLLLMALCGFSRQGAWKSRMCLYSLMLLGTLSLAGYVSALVMSVALFMWPPPEKRSLLVSSWKRVLLFGVLAVIAVTVGLWLYRLSSELDVIASLLAAKSDSAASHVSDLWPDPAMLEFSSPISFLFGAGGFSENLYWRVLVNFGWAGLLQALILIFIWMYQFFVYAREWRRSIGLWSLGLLVGANGIAYLLTFPINLLYWSVLALVVYTAERPRQPALTLEPPA